VVLDVDDLHLVEVELDDQVFDRSGIDMLTGTGPDPGQRPAEAALLGAVGLGVVAGRPGIGHRHVEVGHTALAQRLLPARVLADDLVDGHELLEHDRGLGALNLLPADDLLLGEGDHRLVRLAVGAVTKDDERLPVDLGPVPGLEGENVLLGRLIQHHIDEPVAGVESPFLLEERRRSLDLVSRERVERMPGRRHRWL